MPPCSANITPDENTGSTKAYASPTSRNLSPCARRQRSVFHVGRPYDRADTGHAVRERDVPEPSMIEPEDADVPSAVGILAAPRIAEMRVHGGAVVPDVAALGAEARAEHRVTAGGVDEVTGAPALACTVLPLRYHCDAILAKELDLPRAAAFHDLRAEAAGALEQNRIEARPPDLVCVAESFVPALREIEPLRLPMRRREELHAVLGEPDGRDLRGDPEPLEQRQAGRQQRLANVEAGM